MCVGRRHDALDIRAQVRRGGLARGRHKPPRRPHQGVISRRPPPAVTSGKAKGLDRRGTPMPRMLALAALLLALAGCAAAPQYNAIQDDPARSALKDHGGGGGGAGGGGGHGGM